MSDEEAQAKALLIRSRDWHLQEANRLSRVLDLLDGADGSGVANTGVRLGSVSMDAVKRKYAQMEARTSVRTMLLNLLEEEDRDWSAGEIIHEYERRGTPVRGADPSNALRAAISESNKAQQIVRTAPGRYKSTKWKQNPPPADPDFDQGAVVAAARGNGYAWQSATPEDDILIELEDDTIMP